MGCAVQVCLELPPPVCSPRGLVLSHPVASTADCVIGAYSLVSPVGSYYFATASHDRTVSPRFVPKLDDVNVYMPILATSLRRLG